MEKGKITNRIKLIQKGKMDITFFTLVSVLLVSGLVMLFSASTYYASANKGNSFAFISKQLGFGIIGFIAMFLISKIDYHILRKFAIFLYALSVAMLIAVLLMPPLYEGYAFKRWIIFGPINFQPSEIAKFAIILIFAHFISLNYKKMEKFTYGIVFFIALLGLICGLVVVEPHLSATILIFCIGISLMVVGGIKMRYLALGVGGGLLVGAIVVVTGVVSYADDRIKFWQNPWLAPKGEGYQVIQSLLAIGSGGFMGKGLGNSLQKFWVPEPQNDFIFAIVCEELGLIGALIIVSIFALLVWRGFVIAMRAPDKFGSLLAIGLTLQVGLQAAFNILVVTNTIPNTGISLPFFSYGGTSLMMLLAEMGVVLSISRDSSVQKT